MYTVRISKERAYNWMLIMFVAHSALVTALNFLLYRFGLTFLTPWIVTAIIYLPYIIMSLFDRRGNGRILASLGLFCAVGVFFAVTLLINPHYDEYFFRNNYLSVWNSVFHPLSGGLAAFFVFSMCDDAQQMFRGLRTGTYILLLYNIYQAFDNNSIWGAYDMYGNYIEQSYGLNYGYTTIFCSIVLLHSFLKHRERWYDLLLMFAGLLCCLTQGSRGAFLCLAAYLILYTLLEIKNWSLVKKLLILAVIILAYFLLSAVWADIVQWVLTKLTRLNINSRLIEMLLDGKIASDSGRSKIYEMAWKAIKNQGFLGYGAYGSRWIIAPHYYWGYPHNIFLEFIMEFGWFFGCLFLAIILFLIFRTIGLRDASVQSIMCIFIAANIKLFISDSFWMYQYFWAMLAFMLVVCRKYFGRTRNTLGLYEQLRGIRFNNGEQQQTSQ